VQAAHEYDRMALRIKGAAAELNFPELYGRAPAPAPPPQLVLPPLPPPRPQQLQPQHGADACAAPKAEADGAHVHAHAAAAAATSAGGGGAGHATALAAAALSMLGGGGGDASGGDGCHSGSGAATGAAAPPAAALPFAPPCAPAPAPPKRRRSGRGDTTPGSAGATPSLRQQQQQQHAAQQQQQQRGRGLGGAATAHADFVAGTDCLLAAPLHVAAFLARRRLAPGSAAAFAAWDAECAARLTARAGATAAAAAARFRAVMLACDDDDDDDDDACHGASEGECEWACRAYVAALRRAYPGLILEPYVMSAAALTSDDAAAEDDDGGGGDDDDERGARAALAALRAGNRRFAVFVPDGPGAVDGGGPLDAALRSEWQRMQDDDDDDDDDVMDEDAAADAAAPLARPRAEGVAWSAGVVTRAPLALADALRGGGGGARRRSCVWAAAADAGAAAIDAALPSALRSCRAGGARAFLGGGNAGATSAWRVVAPLGDGSRVRGFAATAAPAARTLHVGAGDLLIAPLATAAAGARLDAIHAAILGACARVRISQRALRVVRSLRLTRSRIAPPSACAGARIGAGGALLPLEMYLEEGLPLVLHARERGGAVVAELPLLCRVAGLTWRAAKSAPPAASGAAAAAHVACLRTELLPAYLLHKIALLEKEEAAAAAHSGGGGRASHADGDAFSSPAAAAFLACVAPCGARALAAAPCTAAARGAWPRAMRPWAAQLGIAAAAADVASADVAPHASVAVVLVRTVEKLCDTLAAAAAAGGARGALDAVSAPPPPLRPAAAAAALRALRPALLDLVQLAPPEAPQPLQPLPQGQHPSASASASAAAAQFVHAPASCGAVLASLAALAAPFSREYIAAVLRDADDALRVHAGGAPSADAPGGALPWLERYLEAPPGSMLRAALVTAAQEAPLAVRTRPSLPAAHPRTHARHHHATTAPPSHTLYPMR
jgi:hypothetical protein